MTLHAMESMLKRALIYVKGLKIRKNNVIRTNPVEFYICGERERGVRYYHMSTITQFISILSYLLKAYETAVEGKKSLMPWKSPRDGGPSSNTNSS